MLRLLRSLLGAFLLPGVLLAGAARADNGEAQWVPFTLTPANQIRFVAMADGAPVSAILDTGVSLSAMSATLAARMRLAVTPGLHAATIGGSVAAGRASVRDVAVGGLATKGLTLAVVALGREVTGGDAVDLLVGQDLLARYALDIDYDARRFRLLPSGRLPFAGVSAPLRIGGVSPAYLTDLAVGGHLYARMIVDTGDGNAVTVARNAWAGDPAPGGTTTLSYGIGGAVVAALRVVPSVELGGLHSAPVEILVDDPAFARATGTSGRIGNGFLQRYRVLLDPAAGRMVIAPGRTVATEPKRSTSGLLLARAGDRLRVLHVMANSPAAAGGWQAGEAICTVDGNAATAGAIDWPAGTPGRTMTLGLCNGTQRALRLRAFY